MFVDRQFSGAPLTPIPCPAAIGLGWLPEWHESPTGLLPEVLDWRARVRGTESPRPPGGSALAKHPRDTSSPRIKKEERTFKWMGDRFVFQDYGESDDREEFTSVAPFFERL